MYGKRSAYCRLCGLSVLIHVFRAFFYLLMELTEFGIVGLTYSKHIIIVSACPPLAVQVSEINQHIGHEFAFRILAVSECFDDTFLRALLVFL